MTFSFLQRIGRNVAAAFALVCLSSCAVPLAPGYQVEKQSITVRFVPGNPPHLAVRAEYRLANVGKTLLNAIDLGLPGQKQFGLGNLRVEIDSRTITPERQRAEAPESDAGESAVAGTWPATWRVPFATPWPRNARRTLIVSYDLAATAATDPRMSIGPNAFYLNDSGWFPDPLEPKALFAKDIVRPDPSDLIVRVPAGFIATASGESRGAHKSANETEFRFRLRKNDPDPFVAAGAYQQQQISASGIAISFWTFERIPPALVEKTSNSLASTGNFLVAAFGMRRAADRSLVVLQAPAADQNSDARPFDRFSTTLPGIVLFRPPSPSQDFSSALLPEKLEQRMALSWFAHVITPRTEAWLLGDSLASYAVLLADEKSGAPPARDAMIRQSLKRFDQLDVGTTEKPIAFLIPGDPAQQREIGGAKSMLFLFALEDRCGGENLEHALAHMVYALRGQEYGYTDLRAALEQECHQDLSSVFATWLDQKGIPPEFRARYANENKSAD